MKSLIKIHFSDKHSQSLSRENLNIGLIEGLGYSISKDKIDLDSNGFKDLVIGAPFSDSAIVLKSRHVLSFIPKFYFENIPTVDPNDESML